MVKKASVGILTAGALLMALSGSVASAATGSVHAKRASAGTQTLVAEPAPIGNFQDNFNPWSSIGSSDDYGVGLMYQPLFYLDNVSGNTFPQLGTKYTWSNGNKTLTVQLRKGVKWSDGKAFTSADVVFTFNLLKKYTVADKNGVWQLLSGVNAAGATEVVFHFNRPNVPFAYYVLDQFIVPEHLWSNLGDPTKAVVTKPVGTGPYVLTQFNQQDLKYAANPSYWGGKLAVRNVEFPAYSGNDSADLALAKDTIDWSGTFIPSIQSVYASRSSHNHYWFPPGNVVMLYTNLKDPLLSQLPVRKAISLAINRQQLYLEGEYGYEPVASPTGLVLPNNKAWLNSSLPAADKQFSLNPNAAIKVLEAAGYKQNAQGIFVSPSGKKLAFTLQVVAGWSDWDTDAALIAQDLKKIGIQVTVQEEQFGAYSNNLTSKTSRDYQLAISWTNTGPSPYFLYENMLASTGNYNVEQLNNKTVNGWLDGFAKTTDVKAQHQDINNLEKYMAEQLPSIPLVFGATWYEYSDAHFTGWPTAANPYINPAPWTSFAQAIVLTHLRPR